MFFVFKSVDLAARCRTARGNAVCNKLHGGKTYDGTVSGIIFSSGLSETVGAFIVKLKVMEDSSISGEVYAVRQEKAISISGLDEAVLVINAWLDEGKFRADGMNLRKFVVARKGEPPLVPDRAGEPGLAGDRPEVRRTESFLIQIFYRQNTSWQGEVIWKNQRICFRSCLELLALIHSVMDGARPERERDRPQRSFRMTRACLI